MEHAIELSLSLDGQAIGTIRIEPQQSILINAITGQTTQIAESDGRFLCDFFERYLLVPLEKHLERSRND
jgi:hypothetical protein